MLGLALAMNLAYLNLPIFSFLTQISNEVSEKIESLPDTTKRHVDGTKWFKDAIEISRVKNLERMEFHSDNSGKKWTPFKSRICTFLFNVLFKFRFGKILACVCIAIASWYIILGVMIGVYPESSATIFFSELSFWPFWLTLFSFLWPIFCVGSGAFIRLTTIRELNYNLRNLGVSALAQAEESLTQAESAVAEG